MFDPNSLPYNSEYPELLAIIYTVLLSVVLGTLLAFTYERTSNRVDRPAHFLQAMILVTIVAATIMQAIGDSLARGLGMLGALSIIRFRTTVRNPRNIVFMFGAIAIGIACGVFGYVIAIFGTLSFCLTAFLLSLSSFEQKENLVGKLRLEIPKGPLHLELVREIIKKHCVSSQMITKRSYSAKKPDFFIVEFHISMRAAINEEAFIEAFATEANLKVIELSFSQVQTETI